MKEVKNIKLMKLNKVNSNGVLYTEESFKDSLNDIGTCPLYESYDSKKIIGSVINIRKEGEYIIGDIHINDEFNEAKTVGMYLEVTLTRHGIEIIPIDVKIRGVSLISGRHAQEELNDNILYAERNYEGGHKKGE